MGETTKISWTDHTWNPWQGCRKVSPGCKNCYAERLVEDRMGRDFKEIRRSTPTTFNAPLKWEASIAKRLQHHSPDAIDRELVFTCSISDFFIEEADAWRDEAWKIIRRTPHLTYQILTKRPERITDHLPTTCFQCGEEWRRHYASIPFMSPHQGWPWPNVWLGTSVENQKYAEERIPKLVSISAAVHFLSCEPLLGPIDFTHALRYENPEWLKDHGYLRDIEWVIAGGESGPDYRPMDPIWIRDIREQCKSGKVAFFFKQWGGLKPGGPRELDGREWNEFPSEAL